MIDNLPRLGDTIRDDEGATLFVIDIVPGQLGEWVTCSRVGCLGYYIQRPIDEVTVIDSIGRATQVKAVDGKVTLTLSGAPLMVYGLQF